MGTTKENISQHFIATSVSLVVGLYGIFVISSTLFDQFVVHRLRFLDNLYIDIHILFGLAFVYLSVFLIRRKQNALILALFTFSCLLVYGIIEVLLHPNLNHFNAIIIGRYIVLPLMITGSLILIRNEFKVKSDLDTFTNSIRLALIVLAITLAYGVIGFMLMDKSDFHHEIGFGSALHHTLDQFDLTIANPLHAYTRRAILFMDSLTFVSVASLTFLLISLFKPVKYRLIDQSENRDRVSMLMERYGASSEEFFKLWPQDKHYFFSTSGDAVLAYQLRKGVALVIGEPVGNKKSFRSLIQQFNEMCWANGWSPTLIHVSEQYRDIYRDNDYQVQLIGQEAIVDVDKFCAVTAKNKYFRNIHNRFDKERFSFEIIEPPHHSALLARLAEVSDDWLSKPGRTERGFVMGYFREDYLQQCKIAIVRDAAQTIQAFLNIIPSENFNKIEATYDMLRSNKNAPPNVNDYLLFSLIHGLKDQGYKKINLGLSPLVGLDEVEGENSLISNVLRFAYTNGDRFYSFSGLHRFKEKYDPIWEDRYLVYMGGVGGFTKMLNALVAAMKLKHNFNRRTH